MDIREYLDVILAYCDDLERVIYDLSKVGLRRPMDFWDSLPLEAREFELEVIKENNASFKLRTEDGVYDFGYRSKLIDEVLQPIGVDRGGLGLFSVSDEQDRLMSKSPYLFHYTKEFLRRDRSVLLDVHLSRNKSEMSKIGVSNILEYIGLGEFNLEKESISKHEISLLIDRALDSFGFNSSKSKSAEYTRDYVSKGDVFKLATRVDNALGRCPPYSIDFFLMPWGELTAEVNGRIQSIKRNGPYSFLCAVVPDFGRYRVSWDASGLVFSVFCYKHLIESFFAIMNYGR